VVEALVQKKDDGREEIKGVEAGKVAVEKPKEGQGPLTIACKNPLAEHVSSTKRPAKANVGAEGNNKPKTLTGALEEAPGGLLARNLSKLSAEDAEAMQELLKDASREGDGDGQASAATVPILMKEGSKKVREGAGSAPEATREMFEHVPVESFGEAMLRGMGYDPDKHLTKPVFRDKPRDNLLGLGAKALLPTEKALIQGKKKAAPAKKAAGASAASSVAASAEEPTSSASAAPAQALSEESSAAGAKRSGQAEDTEAPAEKRRRGAGGADVWASRGLVVRVISKEGRLRDFFGAEAVVLEVQDPAPAQGAPCCRIKARAAGKSHVLQGVRLEELETRVSRDCAEVRVVRGDRKGTVAKLLKRDSAKGVAVVRIKGAEVEMKLDDVCQFMA